MKKKGNIALAIAAGVIVFGAIAYLFTSDEGNKLRRKATEKGRKIFDELERVADDLKCKNEKKETVS